jgi:Fe-S cluster assembly iron-binding protein IscA
MIMVTQAAKEMFQTVEQPEGQVLRLDVVGPQELGLTLGEPQPSDQVVEHDGREVIHIAGELSQAADGATLDRVDTPQGPALIITPPQERQSAPL